MGNRQATGRSTWRRRGRGLSAAAADDFCDRPERTYLGTGWKEETEDGGRRDSSSISSVSMGGKKKSLLKRGVGSFSMLNKSPAGIYFKRLI